MPKTTKKSPNKKVETSMYEPGEVPENYYGNGIKEIYENEIKKQEIHLDETDELNLPEIFTENLEISELPNDFSDGFEDVVIDETNIVETIDYMSIFPLKETEISDNEKDLIDQIRNNTVIIIGDGIDEEIKSTELKKENTTTHYDEEESKLNYYSMDKVTILKIFNQQIKNKDKKTQLFLTALLIADTKSNDPDFKAIVINTDPKLKYFHDVRTLNILEMLKNLPEVERKEIENKYIKEKILLKKRLKIKKIEEELEIIEKKLSNSRVKISEVLKGNLKILKDNLTTNNIKEVDRIIKKLKEDETIGNFFNEEFENKILSLYEPLSIIPRDISIFENNLEKYKSRVLGFYGKNDKGENNSNTVLIKLGNDVEKRISKNGMNEDEITFWLDLLSKAKEAIKEENLEKITIIHTVVNTLNIQNKKNFDENIDENYETIGKDNKNDFLTINDTIEKLIQNKNISSEECEQLCIKLHSKQKNVVSTIERYCKEHSLPFDKEKIQKKIDETLPISFSDFMYDEIKDVYSKAHFVHKNDILTSMVRHKNSKKEIFSKNILNDKNDIEQRKEYEKKESERLYAYIDQNKDEVFYGTLEEIKKITKTGVLNLDNKSDLESLISSQASEGNLNTKLLTENVIIPLFKNDIFSELSSSENILSKESITRVYAFVSELELEAFENDSLKERHTQTLEKYQTDLNKFYIKNVPEDLEQMRLKVKDGNENGITVEYKHEDTKYTGAIFENEKSKRLGNIEKQLSECSENLEINNQTFSPEIMKKNLDDMNNLFEELTNTIKNEENKNQTLTTLMREFKKNIEDKNYNDDQKFEAFKEFFLDKFNFDEGLKNINKEYFQQFRNFQAQQRNYYEKIKDLGRNLNKEISASNAIFIIMTGGLCLVGPSLRTLHDSYKAYIFFQEEKELFDKNMLSAESQVKKFLTTSLMKNGFSEKLARNFPFNITNKKGGFIIDLKNKENTFPYFDTYLQQIEDALTKISDPLHGGKYTKYANQINKQIKKLEENTKIDFEKEIQNLFPELKLLANSETGDKIKTNIRNKLFELYLEESININENDVQNSSKLTLKVIDRILNDKNLNEEINKDTTGLYSTFLKSIEEKSRILNLDKNNQLNKKNIALTFYEELMENQELKNLLIINFTTTKQDNIKNKITSSFENMPESVKTLKDLKDYVILETIKVLEDNETELKSLSNKTETHRNEAIEEYRQKIKKLKDEKNLENYLNEKKEYGSSPTFINLLKSKFYIDGKIEENKNLEEFIKEKNNELKIRKDVLEASCTSYSGIFSDYYNLKKKAEKVLNTILEIGKQNEELTKGKKPKSPVHGKNRSQNRNEFDV